jgi:hypothetical protein
LKNENDRYNHLLFGKRTQTKKNNIEVVVVVRAVALKIDSLEINRLQKQTQTNRKTASLGGLTIA